MKMVGKRVLLDIAFTALQGGSSGCTSCAGCPNAGKCHSQNAVLKNMQLDTQESVENQVKVASTSQQSTISLQEKPEKVSAAADRLKTASLHHEAKLPRTTSFRSGGQPLY